jgi:P pilus assembly chaperone PapD
VGSDTTSSLSGVSASGASGTSVGSYTNAVTASTQTNYSVTTADGTLTISASTSSSVGASTVVVEPDSVTFPLPPRGLFSVLVEVDGASDGGAENPADEWRQASGARLRPFNMTVDALPEISATNE